MCTYMKCYRTTYHIKKRPKNTKGNIHFHLLPSYTIHKKNHPSHHILYRTSHPFHRLNVFPFMVHESSVVGYWVGNLRYPSQMTMNIALKHKRYISLLKKDTKSWVPKSDDPNFRTRNCEYTNLGSP